MAARYFFECLVRKDWREWAEAVKRELQGWIDNDAVTVVNIKDIPHDAKIIPLCELYTIKRDGRYKLRQITLGNLLRKGGVGQKGHYYDTWSSTISGSGIRMFCAIACALNKQVGEYDVSTAYLQGQRSSNLFAYAPSHYGFSDLEMEDIGVLRLDLLAYVKEHGEDALKWLCRKMADTKTASTVLKLNVPIR